MSTPRNIRIFKAAVALVGLGLLVIYCREQPLPEWGTLVFFAAMAFFTESTVIRLPNGVRTSITFALVFPAFFIFGPAWAAAIYAFGTLGAGLAVQRRPVSVVLFNSGQIALSVLVGSYLYFRLNGSPSFPTVLPTVFMVLGFMLTNHILVNTYYSLVQAGRYRFKDWLQSLTWDAVNYALKVPLGFLVLNVYEEFGVAGTLAASISILAITFLLRLQTLLSVANDELRAIQEVSQEVTSSLDLDTVFRLVAGGIGRVTGADSCVVLLWNEERQRLFPVYVSHYQPELFTLVSFGLEDGLPGLVARTRKPEIVADLSREPTYRMMAEDKTRSLAIVPMVSDDRLIGEIMIGKTDPGAFGPKNLGALNILAAQAAVAIENASLYRQTRLLAITDGLTGLYNYRYFHARLVEEVSRSKRTGAPLSLVYIDLNDFKSLNDAYGHLAGDEILREFAGILKGNVRESDVAVRYAGDEFALLLVGLTKDEAHQVAERVKEEVESHHFLKSHAHNCPVKLRISYGVASCPEESVDEDQLIRAADKAMYAMKLDESSN